MMTNSAEGASIAEEFCFSFLRKHQLRISDLFPPPVTGITHDSSKPVKLSRTDLERHVGNYAKSDGYIRVVLENDQLKLIDGQKEHLLTPLTENEFLPVEIGENDSLVERSERRYVFKSIAENKFLFLRVGDREYESGLSWRKSIGRSGAEYWGHIAISGIKW